MMGMWGWGCGAAVGLEMWGWRCGAGAVGPGFTFGMVGQDEEGMWGWRCGAGDVGLEMWGWRCGAGDVGPGFTFGMVGQDEEGMWGWGCGAGDVGLWGCDHSIQCGAGFGVLPSEWWDRMRRGCGDDGDVGLWLQQALWGWRCGAGDVGLGSHRGCGAGDVGQEMWGCCGAGFYLQNGGTG